MKPRALDLFSGAGGVSYGLELAGFDVTAVDIRPLAKYHRGGRFIQADAMTFPLDGYDLITASPPCQGYSALRHLVSQEKRDAYPDLVSAVRERLQASGAGAWIIENVPGAPLAGNLTMLCGTMFGLQTPDGRAELRRHRLFETSWPICLRPACQHGQGRALAVAGHGARAWNSVKEVITVTGDRCNSSNTPRKVLCVAGGKAMSGGMREPEGMKRRRLTMSVTGNTAQTNVERNQVRETYSIDDARAAMQIDWMPMKYLSQAIPPAYSRWLGLQALDYLRGRA